MKCHIVHDYFDIQAFILLLNMSSAHIITLHNIYRNIIVINELFHDLQYLVPLKLLHLRAQTLDLTNKQTNNVSSGYTFVVIVNHTYGART